MRCAARFYGLHPLWFFIVWFFSPPPLFKFLVAEVEEMQAAAAAAALHCWRLWLLLGGALADVTPKLQTTWPYYYSRTRLAIVCMHRNSTNVCVCAARRNYSLVTFSTSLSP